MSNITRIFINLCIVIISIAPQSVLGKGQYEMNDLKVLFKEGSHSELLEHALDIRPILRTDEWKNLIEQSSIQYIKDILQKHSIAKSDLSLIKKISHWPTLKNNEFYIGQRDKFFIRHIRECVSTKPNCIELIKEYNSFQHPVKYSFDLVSLLAKHPGFKEKLFLYAKPLLEHELSEFYCNKGPIKDLVLEHIAGITTTNSSDYNIHPDCFKSLKKFLNKSLLNTEFLPKKSFNTLIAHELIEPKTKRWYLLNHFLNDPGTENIDDALKNLKVLSESPNMRKKILTKLRKLDPLPDTVFKLKTSMSKARMRILNRSFPEYLSLYAETCLGYLSGIKSYPNGNPTPNCHSFFKNIEGQHMISIEQRSKYTKATKFLSN